METKPLLLGALLGIALFVSLFANIAVHEFGHWTVAGYYGLSPEMHFGEAPNGETVSLYSPTFFTTYNAPDRDTQDFLVALSGPLANVLMATVLTAVYAFIPRKSQYTTLLFIVIIMPAILSAIANLLPMPASDGEVVWQFLRNA